MMHKQPIENGPETDFEYDAFLELGGSRFFITDDAVAEDVPCGSGVVVSNAVAGIRRISADNEITDFEIFAASYWDKAVEVLPHTDEFMSFDIELPGGQMLASIDDSRLLEVVAESIENNAQPTTL